MRALKTTRYYAIVILVSTGLALAMGFNSCSEVKFSESSSKGLCLENSQASGCKQEVPPELVEYEDSFTIPISTKKVDILLVLDNSGSMNEDLNKLGQRLNGLIQILDDGGISWQMCHVLTGTGINSIARDWSMSGSGSKKVLLPSAADRGNIFLNTMSGLPRGGSGNEQGLVAIREALEAPENASCFRQDAALSVVLISDEDEKSCGGRCLDWTSSEVPTATQYRAPSGYTNQYRELTDLDNPQKLVDWVKQTFNNKTFINHSIVIQPGDNDCYDAQDKSSAAFFGVIYRNLQNLTGGIAGNICAASYADQLTAMGERTRDAINSVTLRCAPVTQPTVTFTPAMTIAHSVSGNKILFSAPVSEGTVVNVKYVCAK